MFLLPGCGGSAFKIPDIRHSYELGIITSLTANASVTLKESGLKGRANISVKAPGSFRIEILGPFGRTVALIVSDNKEFSIYNGSVFTKYDLGQVPYPLKFTTEEIVSFLTGSFNKNADMDDYRVELDDKGFVSKVVKQNGSSSDELTALMTNYREVSDTVLPFSVQVSFNREVLFINYKDVQINQDLDNILFTHPNL